MTVRVSRTCTQIPEEGGEQIRDEHSRPVADFRDVAAYVLLGDPGSGKSTSFEAECDALGKDSCPVTARRFLASGPDAHPEWQGKTLIIDGLDEVRAGSSDARTPLDAVCQRLDTLGRPRFRLSCREADWLGSNDRRNLAGFSPDGKVTVLRLDSLTEEGIAQILKEHRGVDDGGAFIAAAKEKRVEGLLGNPQSLQMLADIVGHGESWPDSRLELFERACRRLAHEHNEEHEIALRSRASVETDDDAVLDAAGRLCALLLISGAAGYALAQCLQDADYLNLKSCGRVYEESCRQAICTKLFKASADGRFQPIHHHIAEFLGARHLARLIHGRQRDGSTSGHGIPVRRIVALMTGLDGVVVTALRGLSAWLAAQSSIARGDLVQRDAIGVGLYGEVGRFSTDERRDLLIRLQHQVGRLAPVSRTASAFRALATSSMVPAFTQVLADPGREQEHLLFASFTLSVVAQGSALPCLSGTLLAVVRDETWPSDVNARALDAFIYNCPDDREKTCRLKELLEDVHGGQVSDPDDELLGILLMRLYPDDLPASEVWNYFSLPTNQQRLGTYHMFWKWILRRRCTPSQVADHLDALAARGEKILQMLHAFLLDDVALDLLARGLEVHGDGLETTRLYDWLHVGLVSPVRDFPEAGDAARRIRHWLEQRAEIQKAVIAEGIDRCAEIDADRIAVCASEVWRCLYGSVLPADFGLWCLEQAVAATDERVARYFLGRVFGAMIELTGDDGLSLEVLIERTSAHPILASIYSDLSVCRLDANYDGSRKRRIDRVQREDERQQKHQEWIDYVRSNEASLRANRASPFLLHQIAAAYVGALADAEGADPLARLGALFRNDGRLAAVALEALRGAVRRDDLPDADEIIRLRGKRRQHYLELPFLAGLAEGERVAPNESFGLDDRQIRTALAFRYCGVFDDEPVWYRRLLVFHTRLVAEMLIESAKPEMRNRRPYVSGLRELAHNGDHAQVARIASLPLLRAFPIRSATRQLTDLRYLLWAALRYAAPDSFENLIAQKLSRGSMDIAQRACWLTAGLIASPTTWLRPLEEFAGSGERRVRHIAAFLDYRPDAWFSIDRLKTQALQLLIHLVGRAFGPSSVSGLVTREMEASDCVQWMISRLAESPTHEASTVLETLTSDPALSWWRAELIQARNDQLVVRRDAAYRHPDIEQICRTLDDGPPANPADLVALVTDRLDEIACRIRNGNTDDWRQYWNEDPHRRPREPKHEESCRDALLSDLRQCLPDEVDAQPEGQYANDKRADIRISCLDFHIPVEIKKNGHRKLWSALRNELIAQYTRDPATDGYGMYVVLWFGEIDKHRTAPVASGLCPDGPEALRARLEDTLTREEARRISVYVIDVSAPAADAK